MEIPPYDTLATLARDVDPFAVVEHLQALGTPTQVADAYDQLHRDAYWKYKDLSMVVILATAGIHYCFAHAKLAPDDAARADFKTTAKVLASNLASFTWPGWDEPGITITPGDQARGLDAARLNLRLALELQKPFDKVANAAWMLGAHLLAVQQFDDALFHFRYALPEKDHEDYPLFHGYVLLAQIVLKVPAADAAWDALIQTLQTRGDDTGVFARNQLTTARKVFLFTA